MLSLSSSLHSHAPYLSPPFLIPIPCHPPRSFALPDQPHPPLLRLSIMATTGKKKKTSCAVIVVRTIILLPLVGFSPLLRHRSPFVPSTCLCFPALFSEVTSSRRVAGVNCAGWLLDIARNFVYYRPLSTPGSRVGGMNVRLAPLTDRSRWRHRSFQLTDSIIDEGKLRSSPT